MFTITKLKERKKTLCLFDQDLNSVQKIAPFVGSQRMPFMIFSFGQMDDLLGLLLYLILLFVVCRAFHSHATFHKNCCSTIFADRTILIHRCACPTVMHEKRKDNHLTDIGFVFIAFRCSFGQKYIFNLPFSQSVKDIVHLY